MDTILIAGGFAYSWIEFGGHRVLWIFEFQIQFVEIAPDLPGEVFHYDR
jgi:hypothetical protein